MKFNITDYVKGFLVLQAFVIGTYGLKNATIEDTED